MIQFNLLPDVKLEYLKARKHRRLVIAISAITIVASLALLLSVLSVAGLQKKHLSDLSRDITSASSQLQQKPDLNKILTVQNQLQSIGTLHNSKLATPRLFEYLNQVTPAQADITNLTADFTQSSMTITGSADALSTVNQYVDTLKFTTYTTDDDKDTKKKAFGNIVLSSFNLSNDTTGGTANAAGAAKKASYTITLLYDPVIFDITKTVKLDVPSQVTTRSRAEQPTALFTAPTPPAAPAGTGTAAPATNTPAAGGN